jgi:hypothetical protein
MINLNKFIFSGMFIILIIFLFHTHIKEGFAHESDGLNSKYTKVFSDLNRERNIGSSREMDKIINTLKAHSKDVFLKKTHDFMNFHIFDKTSDNPEGTINISPSHPTGPKKLEELEYLDRVINVFDKAKEHNKINQTPTNTIIKGIFGNN